MSQPQQAGLDELFSKVKALRTGFRSQILSQGQGGAGGGILSQLAAASQQNQQQQQQPQPQKQGPQPQPSNGAASNPLANVVAARLLVRRDQMQGLKATFASQIMQQSQQQQQPPQQPQPEIPNKDQLSVTKDGRAISYRKFSP